MLALGGDAVEARVQLFVLEQLADIAVPRLDRKSVV
jgi:hypothetical protein